MVNLVQIVALFVAVGLSLLRKFASGFDYELVHDNGRPVGKEFFETRLPSRRIYRSVSRGGEDGIADSLYGDFKECIFGCIWFGCDFQTRSPSRAKGFRNKRVDPLTLIRQTKLASKVQFQNFSQKLAQRFARSAFHGNLTAVSIHPQATYGESTKDAIFQQKRLRSVAFGVNRRSTGNVAAIPPSWVDRRRPKIFPKI